MQLNMTKVRNRLSKAKLEKIVFVGRFLRMKRAMCMNQSDTDFDDWCSELLSKASASTCDPVQPSSSSGDEDRTSSNRENSCESTVEECLLFLSPN